MKIKTKELQEALALINLVPVNASIESSCVIKMTSGSGNVHFELTGEATSRASVKGEMKGSSLFLNRKLLSAFVGQAQGAEIDFLLSDKTLLLKCSGRKANLSLQNNATGYAPWSPPKPTLPLEEGTLLDLPFLSKYVSTNPNTSNMATVRAIKGIGLVATDSIAIAVRYDEKWARDFELPALVSANAKKLTKIAVDAKGAGVVEPNGYLYQTLQVSSKPYPLDAIKGVVKSAVAANPVMVVMAGELLDALRYLKSFGKLTHAVPTALPTGSLLLSCELIGGTAGTATIEVKANLSKRASEITDPWKLEYLENFLAHLPSSEKVRFAIAERVIVFRASFNKQAYVLAISRA